MLSGDAEVIDWLVVWISVFATLVATFVAFLLFYFFRDFILVHIGQFIIEKVLVFFPQPRNISGIWETKFYKNNSPCKEDAIVSQAFGKVWGIIKFQKGAEQRKYRMKGSIKEGIVVATYETIRPRTVLDRGSFTLQLLPNGYELEGCYSWTDDDSRSPRDDKYVWVKPFDRGINGVRVRKSNIHGRGVFANKVYPLHSDIAYFDGYEVDQDTRHSLTLAGHKIEPTGPLKFLNHSCDPNCYFKDRTLVAKREIHAGKELTINYLDTEDHLSRSFKCNCRFASCTRKIC